MTISAVDLMGERLKTTGYHLTSWGELGLPYNQTLAEQIIATAPEKLIERPQKEDGTRLNSISISSTCVEAARDLARPVVERLFDSDFHDEARNSWELFAVNYYQPGDSFPPHTDFQEPTPATVIILSLSGIRPFKVSGQNYALEPSSIMLLNCAVNPLHSVGLMQGESVSVVVDVPDLIYSSHHES